MTSPTHIGVLNPIRYRGHYYDTETGYYYLQSRYYDPEIGRFINADVLTDTEQGLFSHNMYAYCENNPINSADPSGEILISACVLIGIGVGALIGGAIGSVAGYNTAKRLNIPSEDRWKFVAGYGLGGAIIGGVIGGFMGYGVGVALGASSSSGLVINSVSKAISSVSRNSINHILQSKHAWSTVLKNTSWNSVKGVIQTTLKKGQLL